MASIDVRDQKNQKTGDLALDDVVFGEKPKTHAVYEEVKRYLASLRSGTHEERLGEFADVLAWLATIANVAGVDLSEAVAKKYGSGCPGCGKFVCTCPNSEKP